jgi:3'(2'), 5'-bisphosphate nucleotidase
MSSFDPFCSEADFAVRCVRDACALTQSIEEKMVAPALQKQDRSPVTVADFSVQALVGQRISRSFPDLPLVAEESAKSLQSDQGRMTLDQVVGLLSLHQSGISAEDVAHWIERGQGDPKDRFWILDPVDGTKGFLRGGQYAVALALADHGMIQIGVLGCPHLDLNLGSLNETGMRARESEGVLAVAVRGQGAWASSLAGHNFRRLKVSATSDMADAVILRSYESGHTNEEQMTAFSRELGLQQDPIRLDSQAKYLLLASGWGDLMLRLLSPGAPDYRERIWDQAAGAIIVEEAGGEITDLCGSPLDFTTGRVLVNNRGVLASNRSLHQAALDALLSIGVGGR